CGGVWGYEDLLERLSDPDAPDFEELLDWLGDFDPEAFDMASVNQRLAKTFQ
ncbi:MAG: plasmid pRiA4b ORF-3 family protein, partial [Cyanobacteria bacterium P01_D01_bin.71]